MNKISVVILNWNGCEMLRSFLPSVLRYSEAEGVEVCVADNGSTDQSVEMLRREFPSVRRILLVLQMGTILPFGRWRPSMWCCSIPMSR